MARVSQCHDLDKLLGDLRAAHQREKEAGAEYRELPADLAALVADFSALEKQQSSRLRYPTVKRDKQHESSFDEEIVIPIEPLQVRLEAIIDDLFGHDNFNQPSDCLDRQLGDVAHAQSNELLSLGAYGVPI